MATLNMSRTDSDARCFYLDIFAYGLCANCTKAKALDASEAIGTALRGAERIESYKISMKNREKRSAFERFFRYLQKNKI